MLVITQTIEIYAIVLCKTIYSAFRKHSLFTQIARPDLKYRIGFTLISEFSIDILQQNDLDISLHVYNSGWCDELYSSCYDSFPSGSIAVI